MKRNGQQPLTIYEIQVQGELDLDWGNWFDGLAVRLTPAGSRPATTTLTAAVADQAALRGLMCKLWDLNLALVSVYRMEVEIEEKDEHG
jgi:hypothetical protein